MLNLLLLGPQEFCRVSLSHIFQECEEYSIREKATDEEVFADIYHSLIHSPGSLALLRREHSCAQATAQLIWCRDKDLEQLSRK